MPGTRAIADSGAPGVHGVSGLESDEQQLINHVNLAAVPRGRYCSYGDMASLCGVHVRRLLAWLRCLPDDTDLPWHRLINGQRRIADYPGRQRQYERLAAEGLLPGPDGRYPQQRRWPGDGRTGAGGRDGSGRQRPGPRNPSGA